ncbi:MAG: ATP-binding protein, partial [Rhizobiaceae bacterium]
MTKAASQPDAQQLLGRETERKALLDVLERVSKDRAAGTVSIVGASGQGKTALLAQFIADAVARRWTVFNVVAHESQSNVPLAAVRRLLYGIVDQLGVDIARRYVSGLEHDLFARDPVLAKRFGVEKLAGDEDIYRFQRSFVALLEGMLLDLPIVLAVDDVQWIDGESLRTLKLAIADL